MLEAVRFIYEHGAEFTGAIISIIWSVAGAYIVSTWVRTTPDPIQFTIPDDMTLHIVHHHFRLSDANLPDDEASSASTPTPEA